MDWRHVSFMGVTLLLLLDALIVLAFIVSNILFTILTCTLTLTSTMTWLFFPISGWYKLSQHVTCHSQVQQWSLQLHWSLSINISDINVIVFIWTDLTPTFLFVRPYVHSVGCRRDEYDLVGKWISPLHSATRSSSNAHTFTWSTKDTSLVKSKFSKTQFITTMQRWFVMTLFVLGSIFYKNNSGSFPIFLVVHPYNEMQNTTAKFW
jgi:hypothetical protein